MGEGGSILVIRSGAIGDFIVTLPVIRLLRQSFQKSYLVIVAKNRVRSLMKNDVDEFVDIDGPLLLPFFSEELDRACDEYQYLNSFDLVVSYLGVTGLVSKNLGALTKPRVISANPLPPPNYDRHISEFLLEPLGEIPDISCPPIPSVRIDKEARESSDIFLASCGIPASTPIVAVHPGSGGRRKVFRAENFSRAVNWIQERFPEAAVLAIEGEADEKDVCSFQRLLKTGCLTVKKDDLLDVAAILSRGSLFLGNDSGIAHLAAAVEVPAIVVFRASDPTVWAPKGKQVWIATDDSFKRTVEEVAGRVFSLRGHILREPENEEPLPPRGRIKS